MSKIDGVTCRICGTYIPHDTGYQMVSCTCYDRDAYVKTDRVSFVNKDTGEVIYHYDYTGMPWIAVDGGPDYVRYIGDPGQFIDTTVNDEEDV